MEMILKTIASIFTVGDREEETEQKDGHISSILLVTSLTGILFEFFTEYMNPISWYTRQQYPAVLLIIYVLLLLSLVFWVVLCVLAKYRTSRCLAAPRNDPVSSVVQILYGIFGVGTMIVHFLNFITDIKCYRENQVIIPAFKNGKNYFYMISAVGRFLQIVFICVQVTSIKRLSKFQLKRSLLVNYFLSVILLSNVGVYMFNAFKLVYGIIQHEKAHKNDTIHSNLTTRTCYWTSAITSKFILPLQGILFPLQQEHHLLSICFVASMFPKIADSRCAMNDHVEKVKNDKCRQSLEDETDRRMRIFRIRCNNIIFSASSTAMFIPGLIILVIRQTSSSDGSLLIAWQWCITIPTSVVIVVLLRGFHTLRKEDTVTSAAENYRGYLMDNNTIYILSSVGAMIYNGIGLVFSTKVSHSIWNAMRFALLMVEIYYQTIFIISLKRVGIKVVKKLQYLLLFLLIPNGLSWLYDEFFSLSPNFDEAYEDMIGPSWPEVKQTILPLSSFYRFQSFVFLYRFWKLGKMY